MITSNYFVALQTDQTKEKINDISNTIKSIENNDGNLQQNTTKSAIYDAIGSFFNSTEATLLFCPQDDELTDDCLSRRIYLFDDISNKRN